MKNLCSKQKFIKNLLNTLLIIFLLSSVVLPQQSSNYISSVDYGTAIEGQALNLRANLLQSSNISTISIAYKVFGQTEFIRREMEISGMYATVTIPAEDVLVPYLEYYLLITLRDGNLETYPFGIPDEGAPLQISVRPLSEKDKEILLISPAPGEIISLSDLFISVSMIKAPDNVNKAATKIFLDGRDITSMALFAGDLMIFYADNYPDVVSLGAHSINVEIYDNDGGLYHTITSNFQAVTAEYVQALGRKFTYNGSLKGESRHESYSDESIWYNNVTAEFKGNYSDWNFNGYAYVTSEEKKYLQPQNRFATSIESDWLSLKIGDIYPRFPLLILDGKRVRGFSGSLNLGFFNVQASFGETMRNIEGSLLETIASSQTTSLLSSDVISIDSAKYGQPYGRVSLGTYSRQLFALRPSFGSGENFQLGFSYLHGKDDVGSVEFGGSPEENVVFGTDLVFKADDQRIILTGQVAASMKNTDISTGSLSDADIDSVFGAGSLYSVDPDQVKLIKNLIGTFITVNQFLSPLNPQENASLAAESSLSLNYFNNLLKISWVYRGNDYNSFGQDYIRTDVKGTNFTDRLRLFDNKLFLSFGYESLQDNLQQTKVATTTYNTLNTSISIFPRADFPNITLGYTHYDNSNGLNVQNDSTNAVDDATNRFLAQISYDLIAGIKHSTSLSILTQKREDNSFWNSDGSNTSISLSVSSYWNKDLTSFVSFVYSASELSYNSLDTLTLTYVPVTSQYNYTSFSIGGRYRLLDNKLELNLSISPSFGDFERQAFDFTGQYFVTENFSLIFQARLYRIPNESTNSIIGLTTRLDF